MGTRTVEPRRGRGEGAWRGLHGSRHGGGGGGRRSRAVEIGLLVDEPRAAGPKHQVEEAEDLGGGRGKCKTTRKSHPPPHPQPCLSFPKISKPSSPPNPTRICLGFPAYLPLASTPAPAVYVRPWVSSKRFLNHPSPASVSPFAAFGTHHGDVEGPHGGDPRGEAGRHGGEAVGQGGHRRGLDVREGLGPRRRAHQPQEGEGHGGQEILGGGETRTVFGEGGIRGTPKMRGGAQRDWFETWEGGEPEKLGAGEDNKGRR